MPAACVRRAPAKRIESSRSDGMPSSWEPEVSSWATVANGFARGEGCISEVLYGDWKSCDNVVELWELWRRKMLEMEMWS